ncbi:glycosyltransferase [Pseudarthrobacter sp. efr-133-R2A-89]|uniref:glycosyltransferase n=1 Tax=Pseudarthrobacter sp. efr-133-R2A-89 TaxID=3040302 RepID=UPI0025535047|nr:glycosyltransferase [Pseudarthrobacter sp. efr-133-R2A-89]
MQSISGNREIFERLVAVAGRLAAAGLWEQAAVQAQLAARFAWTDHTGYFGHQGLEEVLGTLRSSIPQLPPADPGGHARRLVVHVATQLYGTGGHTQSIAHWISQDPGSRHQVVLTRQGSTECPAKIAACLPDPRDLVLLDRRPGGLMNRAAALRRVIAPAGVVVVHAHPHDVVPSLALGVPGAPPAVYVNHADHVFWQGTSAAAVVLCLRASGRELTVRRRGVDAGRCVVANRPLELAPAGPAEESKALAARTGWGVPATDFVVVSAAAASKYDPVGPDSLIGLFRSFLLRRPNAHLLVAGPSPTGAWAAAAAATNGRIRAVGRLANISSLLSIADAYVDSFPFASLTSMLEAGAHGLPLVTYRGHPAECAVLGSDSPGLDDLLLTPSTPAGFVSTLADLAGAVSIRRARGSDTRRAIVEGHSPSAWRKTAERVYTEAALARSGPIAPGPTPWADGPLDQLVGLVQQETGFAGLDAAWADILPFLGTAQRIRQWTAWRKSPHVGLAQLVPDHSRAWVSDSRRRLSQPS